jgi:hypothetical protein
MCTCQALSANRQQPFATLAGFVRALRES